MKLQIPPQRGAIVDNGGSPSRYGMLWFLGFGFQIPGPYADDAAAEAAGVALTDPYYKTDGSVVVRLT